MTFGAEFQIDIVHQRFKVSDELRICLSTKDLQDTGRPTANEAEDIALMRGSSRGSDRENIYNTTRLCHTGTASSRAGAQPYSNNSNNANPPKLFGSQI